MTMTEIGIPGPLQGKVFDYKAGLEEEFRKRFREMIKNLPSIIRLEE